MTIYYVDYVGGNNANDGLSFANRKKLVSAVSAAVGGDAIRVMQSPAPTSLGVNGTWTSSKQQTQKNIVSSTNASPIVLEVTGHGFSTGDLTIVANHGTNTAANGIRYVTVVDADHVSLDGTTGNGVGAATGNIRQINNNAVVLASAQNKDICACEDGVPTNFTVVTNVTTGNAGNDGKIGTVTGAGVNGAPQLIVSSSFTTGKMAYITLAGGAQDYSAYQQVSVWLKQSSGTLLAAGDWSIKLCSDTTGDVPVDTLNIPALGSTLQWTPTVIDKGSALGASIQSVAIYANVDLGAVTVAFSNMVACKAGGLTHRSLIGKNVAGEHWWGIQSIKGARILLDQSVNSIPGASPPRGYFGTSETVTTYIREPIATAQKANNADVVDAFPADGSVGSPILISGGWDSTNMSTQVGETYCDGQNGRGIGFSLIGADNITIEKFGWYRYFDGSTNNSAGSNIIAQNCAGGNNTSTTLNFNTTTGLSFLIDQCVAVSNSSNGLVVASPLSSIVDSHASCIGSVGISVQGGGSTIDGGTAKNCGTGSSAGARGIVRDLVVDGFNASGLSLGNSCLVYNPTISNGSGGALSIAAGVGSVVYGLTTSGNLSTITMSGIGAKVSLKDASVADTNLVTFSGSPYNFYQAWFENYNLTGFALGALDGGTIQSQDTVRHTASGVAWQMSPTSATRSVDYPLELPVAKVACQANVQVDVSGWFRRDDTGLTMRLVLPGGQIAGADNDVTDSMTASANTWEELTISFTPTEDGVVEIVAQAWGGTTFNGYVDDLTITQ